MKRLLLSPIVHLKAVAFLGLFAYPDALMAQAVEYIGGSNSDWSNASSWNGTAPGASGIAIFSNNSGTPSHITSDYGLGSLSFTALAAKTISIGEGAKLTLYGTGESEKTLISNLSNQSLTLSGAGKLALGGTGIIDVGLSNRSITITSAITESGGSRGIVKTGAGMLNLFNATASDFSGGITLKEGTLTTNVSSTGTANAPTQGPLGTGTFTLQGGTFRYTGSSTGVFHNSVSILGDITLGDSAADRRSFTFTGDIDLNGAQRNLNIALHDPNTPTRNIQFTGSLRNGGLTKSGAGILRLTGSNSYTGRTLITEGVLSLAGGGSISESERIEVYEDAVFEISNNYLLSNGQRLTGSGTVIGDFRIGNGIVTSGADGEVLTLSTNTTLDGGKLELDLQEGGLASLLLEGADLHITGNLSGAVQVLISGINELTTAGSYLLISTEGISNATYNDWGVDAFTLQPVGNGWTGALRMEKSSLYLDIQPIPEPGAWVLFGIAAAWIGWHTRRRTQP